jgi:hypothetical protein
LTPEERKAQLAQKRQQIRLLESEVHRLVESCPHQIISREPDIKNLEAQDKIWREWHEFSFKPAWKMWENKAFNKTEAGKRYYDEVLGPINKSEPERVWSFGGAYCLICNEDFGWYCPTSPTKHCDYTQPEDSYHEYDEDDCRYCHLPDERK